MHGDRIHFTVTTPDPTTADALAEAAKNIAATVSAAAIICFTTSGSTARRIARERPSVPLLVLTPKLETARRLGLLWGTHAVHTRDVESFEEMVAKAKRMALRHDIAEGGRPRDRDGGRAVPDAGIDQRAPRRAADRRRAERVLEPSAVQVQVRCAPAAVAPKANKRADEGPGHRP